MSDTPPTIPEGTPAPAEPTPGPSVAEPEAPVVETIESLLEEGSAIINRHLEEDKARIEAHATEWATHLGKLAEHVAASKLSPEILAVVEEALDHLV